MVNLKNLHLQFGEKISRKSFDNSRENLKLNKKFIQGYKINFAKNARENGQVAILTVVMFMLLFSVLVVSFTRIMVAASHETQSDELKAQALAAAESGIEDAKRILTYCYNAKNTTDTTDDTLCANAKIFNSDGQNCSTILGTNLLAASGGRLNTQTEGAGANKQVKVGDANSAERYLCLMIKTMTADVEKKAEEGKSVIIPLNFRKTDGSLPNLSYVKIEWHNNASAAAGGDGQAASLLGGSDLPSKTVWNNTGNRPAVLRVEIVAVPKSSFTINDLTNLARAATVRPSTAIGGADLLQASTIAGSGGLTAYNINILEQKTSPNATAKPPLVQLGGSNRCSAAIGKTYACQFTFMLANTANQPIFNLTNYSYYLRIQTIYKGTHLKVSGYDMANSSIPLLFDGVQPEIDVTGRAIDAFQRVKARVEPVDNTDPDANWFPEYAIDTGGKVCKNLSVTAESGTDNCNYE